MREGDDQLHPLDPERDPIRWERMVDSIMAAAEPELERRLVLRSPLLLLTQWLRPTLTASAAVAALAASALLFVESTPASAIHHPVAEGVGIPAPLLDWMETGDSGEVIERVFALDGGS